MSEDIQKHVKTYIAVLIALLVGTVLTVAVSYMDFGHYGNIVLALIIATAKAALVVLFFMHLIAEKKTIYWIMGMTAFFFFGLMFITMYSMADHVKMP